MIYLIYEIASYEIITSIADEYTTRLILLIIPSFLFLFTFYISFDTRAEKIINYLKAIFIIFFVLMFSALVIAMIHKTYVACKANKRFEVISLNVLVYFFTPSKHLNPSESKSLLDKNDLRKPRPV